MDFILVDDNLSYDNFNKKIVYNSFVVFSIIIVINLLSIFDSTNPFQRNEFQFAKFFSFYDESLNQNKKVNEVEVTTLVKLFCGFVI